MGEENFQKYYKEERLISRLVKNATRLGDYKEVERLLRDDLYEAVFGLYRSFIATTNAIRELLRNDEVRDERESLEKMLARSLKQDRKLGKMLIIWNSEVAARMTEIKQSAEAQ